MGSLGGSGSAGGATGSGSGLGCVWEREAREREAREREGRRKERERERVNYLFSIHVIVITYPQILIHNMSKCTKTEPSLC